MLTLRRKPGEALVMFDKAGDEIVEIRLIESEPPTVRITIPVRGAPDMVFQLAFDRWVRGGIPVSVHFPDDVDIYRDELLDADGRPPKQ